MMKLNTRDHTEFEVRSSEIAGEGIARTLHVLGAEQGRQQMQGSASQKHQDATKSGERHKAEWHLPRITVSLLGQE